MNVVVSDFGIFKVQIQHEKPKNYSETEKRVKYEGFVKKDDPGASLGSRGFKKSLEPIG